MSCLFPETGVFCLIHGLYDSTPPPLSPYPPILPPPSHHAAISVAPDSIVRALIHHSLFSLATRLTLRLFTGSHCTSLLSLIFTPLSRACVSAQLATSPALAPPLSSPPSSLPIDGEVSVSSATKLWALLRSLLQCCLPHHPSLHELVAREILEASSCALPLPVWLTDIFLHGLSADSPSVVGGNRAGVASLLHTAVGFPMDAARALFKPDAQPVVIAPQPFSLIHVYLEFGMLQEAARQLLMVLNAWKAARTANVRAAKHLSASWLSHPLVDRLRAQLSLACADADNRMSDDERQRLRQIKDAVEKGVAEYVEQVYVDSQDMRGLAKLGQGAPQQGAVVLATH